MGRPRAIATLSLAVAMALSGCQAEIAEPIAAARSGIIYGELSKDGEHPETALLWRGGPACTATLVTPRILLTARHCVESVPVEELQVYFGNDPMTEDGTWMTPSYTTLHASVDIALITLSIDAPAQPVPFRRQPLGGDDVGRSVTIVGFGDTGDPGSAGVKRDGISTVHLLDHDFFFVGANGSKTCFGDSGGPTFLTVNNEKYLIGVSSFITSSDCRYGSSGNVRTDAYTRWLEESIEQIHDPSCDVDGLCGEDCPGVDLDCPCSRNDGFCSASCDIGLTNDPDCCDEDSVCNPACDDPDPDCARLGDECTHSDECETGVCGTSGDTSRCITACNGSAGSCPRGFECVDGSRCWPAQGGCSLSRSPSPPIRLGLFLMVASLVLCRRNRRK